MVNLRKNKEKTTERSFPDFWEGFNTQSVCTTAFISGINKRLTSWVLLFLCLPFRNQVFPPSKYHLLLIHIEFIDNLPGLACTTRLDTLHMTFNHLFNYGLQSVVMDSLSIVVLNGFSGCFGSRPDFFVSFEIFQNTAVYETLSGSTCHPAEYKLLW